MPYKIMMSNLGYARGISGHLKEHIMYSYRHLYCPVKIQQRVLKHLKNLIDTEKPDLGCLIEIDKGSMNSAYFNQIGELLDEHYRYHDIENKYRDIGRLRRMPVAGGKSNAFFSNRSLSFKKLYFTHGTKRLIYQITLDDNITIYFAHFSLRKRVRLQQFAELKEIVAQAPGEVIILGDFNVFSGFTELAPLLEKGDLKVMNSEHHTTFTFHRWKKTLDLCICSQGIADKVNVKIMEQPFSDHAALMVEVNN